MKKKGELNQKRKEAIKIFSAEVKNSGGARSGMMEDKSAIVRGRRKASRRQQLAEIN